MSEWILPAAPQAVVPFGIAWARASLPSPAVKNEISSSSSNAACTTRSRPDPSPPPPPSPAELLAHGRSLVRVELGQLRLEPRAHRHRAGARTLRVLGHRGRWLR